MNATFKSILIVVAKNAVNAVLTNSGLMLGWGNIFNIDSIAGVVALLKATGIVVVSREVIVWIPKLIAWSKTD